MHRVPAAQVLQPGLPPRRVAGWTQARVQAPQGRCRTKPNSNESDTAKSQVTNSDHPDRKNIKNHTPDKSYAEPSNGPACVDPDTDPDPDSDLPAHHDIPDDPTPLKKSMKKTGGKTMWAHISTCFDCGTKGHDLSRCAQCEEAFYCDQNCETRHAKAHGPVCTATVAAKARRARRERVARAVRQFGKTVEGAEEDALCVICQAKPVNPVEVRARVICPQWEISHISNSLLTSKCMV